MKTFKFTLPMLAVFFGLTTVIGSAVADQMQIENQDETFWTFTGDDPTDPADYSNQGSPSDCQEASLVLCGVMAPPNGSQPDLTALQGDLDEDESQINYTNPDIYAGPRTQ